MNIYLKWKSQDTFVLSHISIFHLEISQEEDHFAQAKFTIDALTSLPPAGTEGVLEKEDGTLLLRGQLVGTPVKVDTYFSDIELIAIPQDFQEKNETLQRESRVSPYWNGLWFKPEKHNDFQDIQTINTASLYCHRITGELSWSDWFKGQKRLRINQNFFQDSLSIKTLKTPLKSCTVNVTAHWIQSERGVDNLGPAIRRAFPHFKMSTYTHKSLSTKWPKKGHRVGKSGVWVLKSGLKKINPPGKLYKRVSSAIPIQKEGKPERTYRAIRHWYKPSLWVGWGYQQKRTETLSVTLHHNVQPFSPTPQDHKTVEFTLQNINPDPKAYAWQPEAYYPEGSKVIYETSIYRCHTSHTSSLTFEKDQAFWNFKRIFLTPLGHPARTSFFLTDQGYEAAEHAMERAKNELAKSARCLEIYLEGTWEGLESITTDTSVSLSDRRLPGEKVTGKVVKYSLIAEGDSGKRWVKLTLLTPLRKGDSKRLEITATPSYALKEYCEDPYQVYENACSTTPSGLHYFRYDDQTPPKNLRHEPLLRGLELINGPLEQESKVLEKTYETPQLVEKALSQHATRLRLYFKDLRTKERLNHRITVKMAAPWAPSKQH